MEYRFRLIEHKLREYARHFKIVLVLGARQVGKSTLLRHVFPSYRVVVFDPMQDLYGAKTDPELFLSSFPSPIILDEIQYVPDLLSVIKRKVDLKEESGQYFLTGSQNLHLLKTVAESMAGRVGILPLDGFTLGELKREVKTSWLDVYLKDPLALMEYAHTQKFQTEDLLKCLWRGFMPGTLALPDSLIPGYYASYIQTYVERDVRTVENIREMAEFDRFLRLLGALTAQETNLSQLGRDIGVSPTTARRWLDLLGMTYQWLELEPYQGNVIKRLSGKRKGYLRDTGMACYLQRITSSEALLSAPFLGALFESFGVNNIYRQFGSMDVPPYAYHWRTSSGAEVDLVLERDGKLYPIEFKCKTTVTKKDIRGIHAFRETYPKKEIMPAVVIYAGTSAFLVDEKVVAIPWNMV